MGAKSVKMRPLTRNQMIGELAERTTSNRAAVKILFDVLTGLISEELHNAGVCNLFGLMKIKSVLKPAQKGGEKKLNPFTKEMMVTKARPARHVVKVLPLKTLKDMIN